MSCVMSSSILSNFVASSFPPLPPPKLLVLVNASDAFHSSVSSLNRNETNRSCKIAAHTIPSATDLIISFVLLFDVLFLLLTLMP